MSYLYETDYDKPKPSWRAQVGQRAYDFWHVKQWHMFNYMRNSSVGKSQRILFRLLCDTGWLVWYPKVHYYNLKFRGILAHRRFMPSLCCNPRTFCSAIYLQDKQKRNKSKPGISDHIAVGVFYRFQGQFWLPIYLPPGSRGFLLYELLNLTGTNICLH